MTTTRKRKASPRAGSGAATPAAPPSPEAIERARAAMRSWAPSTRTSTGVIALLADDIDALIARGAKPRDVVEVLAQSGVALSMFTLRDHLRRRAATPSGAATEVQS